MAWIGAFYGVAGNAVSAEYLRWLDDSASSYLISTANDMGKYLQFYLNGGQGVLSPDSIRAMLRVKRI